MKSKRTEACRKCGGTEWMCIPDSLADACIGCGQVMVMGEYGASLQEWAKDLYEAAQKQKQEDVTNSGAHP